MKRNIKFRGKSIESNEWVYGNLVVDSMTGNKMSIIDWADMSEDDKNGGAYVWNDIIHGTESQFTELKDANNKEIYEGDILRKTDNMGMTGCAPRYKIFGNIKKVIFHEASFRLTTSLASKKYHLASQYIRYYGFEIIGNIYEKPELLDTKKA